MRLEVKTTASLLNIRKGPGTNTAVTGSLPKNSVVNVTEEQNGWYKLENGKGWISKSYTTITKNLDQSKPPQKSPDTTPKNTTDKITDNSSSGKSNGIDAKVMDMLLHTTKNYFNRLDASTRLFGAPFQFIEATDFRLNSEMGLGRKYLENIVAESPIVYFVPGKPNYLPDLSEAERKSMTSFFTSNKGDDQDNRSAVDKILGNQDIRYFDFITDYAEYIKYVNLLCRMCAIYIGIADKKVPWENTTYKYYDWGNYKYRNDFKPSTEKSTSVFDLKNAKDDLLETMFGRYKYVQFYVQPNTSFSESSSNSTNTSKLEGFFDSAEGIIKEMSFLTNTTKAVKNFDEAKETFAKGMDDIAQNMLKNSKENFFSRLLGMSSTVLNGSNIVFPELWGDSAYNKSYNITINLISPYGDKESIYLNILVPLMHILALALPRQTTANSYASPFLVKAFAKGWFSCELGIIDSINIEKGGDGSWTVDGLPSEMRVSIGVKDLYSDLMITSATKPDLFFQNQGLIDFLAVTCGLDVTKPNFLIKLESMFAIFFNKAVDLPSNAFRQFVEDIRNRIEPLIRY